MGQNPPPTAVRVHPHPRQSPADIANRTRSAVVRAPARVRNHAHVTARVGRAAQTGHPLARAVRIAGDIHMVPGHMAVVHIPRGQTVAVCTAVHVPVVRI